MKKNRFNVLDRVYHVTPDSPIGVVIDIRYIFSTMQYEYQVSFSPLEESYWYYEHELSENKTF